MRSAQNRFAEPAPLPSPWWAAARPPALVAGVLVGGLPLLVDVAPWFENVNRVLPGTMGIALGRNPNGIAHQIREGLAPLRRRPVLLAGTAAGVAVVVGLRLVDVLTGTPFALALLAVPAAGGLAAQVLAARRAAGAAAAEGPDDVPLEWAGIVRPFTAEEVATMDRVLGLEQPWDRAPGLAGAPSGVSAPARTAAGVGR